MSKPIKPIKPFERVRVTLTHNAATGQSRFIVNYAGTRRVAHYDYGSSDPFLTAMLDVLGRGVRVTDDERDYGRNVIVFYIEPATVEFSSESRATRNKAGLL